MDANVLGCLLEVWDVRGPLELQHLACKHIAHKHELLRQWKDLGAECGDVVFQSLACICNKQACKQIGIQMDMHKST